MGPDVHGDLGSRPKRESMGASALELCSARGGGGLMMPEKTLCRRLHRSGDKKDRGEKKQGRGSEDQKA